MVKSFDISKTSIIIGPVFQHRGLHKLSWISAVSQKQIMRFCFNKPKKEKKWLDNCKPSLGCATISTLSSVFCTIFTPSPDLLSTDLQALNTKTFVTNTSDSGNKTVKYDWEYAVKRIFANVLIRKAEISANNLTSELYTALWKRIQGRATNVSFPILNSFTSCKWDDKLWQYID